MSPLADLCILCALLFAGSLFSGYVPMAFNITAHSLLLASTVGAGLLVGTALIVIIPEGIHTLYSGGKDAVNPSEVGLTMALGFVLMLILDRVAAGYGHAHGPAATTVAAGDIELTEGVVTPRRLGATGSSGMMGAIRACLATFEGSAAIIGLLVHNAVDGFALGVSAVSSGHTAERAASGERGLSFLVFLAILLHKAPAALALSTFLLQQRRTKSQVMRQLFVFCGIIPVAAIVTYSLMSTGGSGGGDASVLHSATTTLAAPAAASDSHGHDHGHGASAADASQMRTVGLALLFSGGTFLYVACMHILPEIQADIMAQLHESSPGAIAPSSPSSSATAIAIEAGHAHSHHAPAHGRAISAADLPWKYVFAIIGGAMMPLMLAGSHSH
jgi:zinc transporter 9